MPTYDVPGYDEWRPARKHTMLDAAREGRLGQLRCMLQTENVNRTDGRNWTALHKACWAGNDACVWAILEHTPDLELRTNRGDTALEMAVWNGLGCNKGSLHGGKHKYEDCVELLVSAGAIMTEGAWKDLTTDFQSEKHQKTSPTPPTAETPSTAIVAVPQGDAEPDDSTKCVICIDSERTHAFVPCGHRCVCDLCSRVVPATCPLCRKPVKSRMRIYG